MIAGVIANTAAVCASVAITKDILDDPTRAAFYQSHWYIVWLVGLVLLSGACAAAFMGSRCATPLTRARPSQWLCRYTCSPLSP